MSAVELLGLNLLMLLLCMSGLWLLSLKLKDASIVDNVWGLGFALIATATLIFHDGYLARQGLITALCSIWGLRLSLHIAWRNWGQPEDRRYAAMRKHHGSRFRYLSLFLVFWFQGGLIWLIGMPLQVAQLSAHPPALGLLEALGSLVWAIGLLFETIADWQLSRFRADADNATGVMDRGLWRYTRHPNYFGDALVWWGLFIVCAAADNTLFTIFSPLLMTFLLLRVSGVPLLEASLTERRPGYAQYIRKTSRFIPWPPRR